MLIFLKAVRRGDTKTADLFGTHPEVHVRQDGVVQTYHVASAAPTGNNTLPITEPQAMTETHEPHDESAEQPAVLERWVSEDKLAELKGLIEKYQRKAKKLKMDPVTLTEHGERFMRHWYIRQQVGGPHSDKVQTVRVLRHKDAPAQHGWEGGGLVRQVLVRAEGHLPRVNGWTIAASLEHETDDKGNHVNLVRTVPGGGPVAPQYRFAAPYCDHCASQRRRLNTYVLTHQDGRTKQVGSTCLQDFTNDKTADQLAAMAEWQSAFWSAMSSEDGDGDFDGYGAPRRKSYEDPDAYLPHVAAMIRTYGFVSRGKAEETGRQATAQQAMDNLYPPHVRYEKVPVTDEDKALAAAARDWARQLTDADTAGNDYLYNLHVLASREGFSDRQTGYLASLIPTYLRATAPAKPALPSAYQGTVGKRQVFAGLTVERVIPVEGHYGMTYIHKLRDASGNVFTWFASGNRLDEGKTYDVKATVKKHEEYEGVPQTVLTRADAKPLEPMAKGGLMLLLPVVTPA